jgi:hypothetical protein
MTDDRRMCLPVTDDRQPPVSGHTRSELSTQKKHFLTRKLTFQPGEENPVMMAATYCYVDVSTGTRLVLVPTIYLSASVPGS